jgi:uncharacterized protein (DUF427 family)
MSIQLTTSNPFSSPVTLAYGSTGKYIGTVEFSLLNLCVSSVSAVSVDAMTAGFSGANPVVVFALEGGASLPYLLTLSLTDPTITIPLSYSVSANNNYLHASTVVANISSAISATARLSAGGVTWGAETTAYSNAAFGNGFINALGDAANPNPVSSLVATAGDKSVVLTWNNPVDADWASTTVEQGLSPVSAIGAGTVIYTGVLSSTTATAAALNGEAQYFGVYTTDNVAKNSTVVQASATPTWGIWTSLAEHSRLYVEGAAF